ncbi:MAG: hypothetical protein IAE91_04695 [Ignavibacteriaceae bacterium]|nr:hypothetical protein [Ignavibacteriaceae bacterium]
MKYNLLIEASEQKILELLKKSQLLQAEIDEINKNIAERTREFNIPKFNTYDILGKLLGYAKGWLTFLKNSQAPEENVKKLSEKFDFFLKLKNLNNRGILLND